MYVLHSQKGATRTISYLTTAASGRLPHGPCGSRCAGTLSTDPKEKSICCDRNGRFYKMRPEVYAVPNQKARTLAEALLDGLFACFGVPTCVYTDQGRNFAFQLFSNFCRQLGIQKTSTTARHPQREGLVEWYNSTLATQLYLCVSQDQQCPLLFWNQHGE